MSNCSKFNQLMQIKEKVRATGILIAGNHNRPTRHEGGGRESLLLMPNVLTQLDDRMAISILKKEDIVPENLINYFGEKRFNLEKLNNIVECIEREREDATTKNMKLIVGKYYRKKFKNIRNELEKELDVKFKYETAKNLEQIFGMRYNKSYVIEEICSICLKAINHTDSLQSSVCQDVKYYIKELLSLNTKHKALRQVEIPSLDLERNPNIRLVFLPNDSTIAELKRDAMLGSGRAKLVRQQSFKIDHLQISISFYAKSTVQNCQSLIFIELVFKQIYERYWSDGGRPTQSKKIRKRLKSLNSHFRENPKQYEKYLKSTLNKYFPEDSPEVTENYIQRARKEYINLQQGKLKGQMKPIFTAGHAASLANYSSKHAVKATFDPQNMMIQHDANYTYSRLESWGRDWLDPTSAVLTAKSLHDPRNENSKPITSSENFVLYL